MRTMDRLRILIVDDKETNSQPLRDQLSEVFFHEVDFDVAPDPDSALELLAEAPYDLVLLDCHSEEHNSGFYHLKVKPAAQRLGIRHILYTAQPEKVLKDNVEDALDEKVIVTKADNRTLISRTVKELKVRVFEIIGADDFGATRHDGGSLRHGARSLSRRSLLVPLYRDENPDALEFTLAAEEGLAERYFVPDTLGRALSYYFKAAAYAWGDQRPPGLSPQETFGSDGEATSALDLLTHSPFTVPSATGDGDGSPSRVIGAACAAALRDLPRFESHLHHSNIKAIEDHVRAASGWESFGAPQTKAASSFVKPFRVSLADLWTAVAQLGRVPEWEVEGPRRVPWDKMKGHVLYAGYYPATGGRIRNALRDGLANVVAGIGQYANSKGQAWGVIFRYVGPIATTDRTEDARLLRGILPYLEIVLGHADSEQNSRAGLADALQRYHSLGSARDLLRGYASWSFQDGPGSVMHILPGSAGGRIANVWLEAGYKGWNSVHLLRVGIPALRVRDPGARG